MRIWLSTWNTEQMFPSQAKINQLLDHANGTAGAIANCDIVAMGFQEASRNPPQPNVAGYTHVYTVSAAGQTKNTENCQVLFIYARNGGAFNVDEIGSSTRTVQRSAKKKILFWSEYGKGSCNCLVRYSTGVAGVGAGVVSNYIVISSVHLDSKQAAKRTRQVAAAESEATAMHGAIWGAHFMMGDLNYRLDGGGATTMAQMEGYLANNRGTLFQRDTLENDAMFNPATSAWRFPDPIQGDPTVAAPALYLPSYKRHYKHGKGVVAANKATLITANPTYASEVLDFKPDDNGFVKTGSRPGLYDMGWLDRIGYRVNAPTTVTHIWSGSPEGVWLSDHTPVYSVFNVV